LDSPGHPAWCIRFAIDSVLRYALSSCAQLQELNTMVTVRAFSGPLTPETVAFHNVMVMTTGSIEELKYWNGFCHSRSVGNYTIVILYSACTSYVYFVHQLCFQSCT
jgi:hypothetical protein